MFSQVPLTREPTCTQPLTQGPHGQPSPLRTPNGRPGVQGIFPSSRGKAPHGWPMAHHSMATGFPIPWGCYLPLSVTPRSLVRNPAMSPSSLPDPVTQHEPFPAPCYFPLSWGCSEAFATLSSWSRPFFPSLIPCLYSTGPQATQWRGPTGSSSIHGPFRAPCTGRSYPAPLCLGGLIPTGPVGGPFSWSCPRFQSRYPCLYPTWPPAPFVFSPPCRLLP